MTERFRPTRQGPQGPPVRAYTQPDLPVLRCPDDTADIREDAGTVMVGFFEPVAKPWGMKGIPEDSEFIWVGAGFNLVGFQSGPGAGRALAVLAELLAARVSSAPGRIAEPGDGSKACPPLVQGDLRPPLDLPSALWPHSTDRESTPIRRLRRARIGG